MTEHEKMLAGKIYAPFTEGMPEERTRAHYLCREYNHTFETESDKRNAILRELIPDTFYCQEGAGTMTAIQDSARRESFGLSGNVLKVIAIIAMTIDHIAWMGIEEYSQAEVPLQIFS